MPGIKEDLEAKEQKIRTEQAAKTEETKTEEAKTEQAAKTEERTEPEGARVEQEMITTKLSGALSQQHSEKDTELSK